MTVIFYIFSAAHISSANMEGEQFMVYPAASHQGAFHSQAVLTFAIFASDVTN